MSLRLLLDENAESHYLVNYLTKYGYNVIVLKDLAAKGSTDLEILELTRKHKRILYTRDRDFLELVTQVKNHNGIIFEFRTGTARDMTVSQIAEALALIESTYRNLQNQLIVINTFKNRGLKLKKD